MNTVYYSNGLFSSTIISELAPNGSIVETALCQLFLVLVSLPGYFIAAILIDKQYVGRKRLQIFGLFTVAMLLFAVGGLYSLLRSHIIVFVCMYSLIFLFCQLGPNSTTFVIPAEVFPTAIRARAHGISAAFGKAGAAVGAIAMMPLIDSMGGLKSNTGPAIAFAACGVVALVTIPLTFLVPETAGKPLGCEDAALHGDYDHTMPGNVPLQDLLLDNTSLGTPSAEDQSLSDDAPIAGASFTAPFGSAPFDI